MYSCFSDTPSYRRCGSLGLGNEFPPHNWNKPSENLRWETVTNGLSHTRTVISCSFLYCTLWKSASPWTFKQNLISTTQWTVPCVYLHWAASTTCWHRLPKKQGCVCSFSSVHNMIAAFCRKKSCLVKIHYPTPRGNCGMFLVNVLGSVSWPQKMLQICLIEDSNKLPMARNLLYKSTKPTGCCQWYWMFILVMYSCRGQVSVCIQKTGKLVKMSLR